MVDNGSLVNNGEKVYRRRRRMIFFHTTSASLPDVHFFILPPRASPGHRLRKDPCGPRVHGSTCLPNRGAEFPMPVLKEYRGPLQPRCLGNVAQWQWKRILMWARRFILLHKSIRRRHGRILSIPMVLTAGIPKPPLLLDLIYVAINSLCC